MQNIDHINEYRKETDEQRNEIIKVGNIRLQGLYVIKYCSCFKYKEK